MSWDANILDSLIWERVQAALSNPSIIMAGIEELRSESKQLRSYEKEIAQIETNLNHAEKEKDRVWYAFRVVGDESKFKREIKVVMGNIEELEKRRAEIEGRLEVARRAELNIEGIENACQIARDNLKDFSFENKRLALEALNINIWLDGNDIRIEGTLPAKEGSIVSTSRRRCDVATGMDSGENQT